MYPYRVFISYSREDQSKAERLAKYLESLRLAPIWDKDFTIGNPFTEQIKENIAFAHAFVPLITELAVERPWVHQEIGYAVGLNVPVLPVAINAEPEGIIRELHTISVGPDLHELAEKLPRSDIERHVHEARRKGTFERAELPEQRARMIGDYANKVFGRGGAQRVRHCGALTSFSLPDKPPDDPIWDKREGKIKRGLEHRESLREERMALEKHTRKCGCDLIIDTSITFKEHGPGAREARYGVLKEFLESMPDDMVRVVIRKRETPGNLLIVGDWFTVESASPHMERGYMHTVFTRHAPTVLNRVRQFDEDFRYLLEKTKTDPSRSLRKAIAAIEAVL